MMNWIRQHFRQIIYVSFLFPILLVAFVSISHVTAWYGIANPFSWAIYLSVAVEVAALSSLAAIVAKMGKKVFFPFGIVTLIQFIGNIFFSYQYIDITTQVFKDWVDLVSPLVTFIGVEPTDMIGHKRLLSFLTGGMLPIISLTFLGLLVRFEEDDRDVKEKDITPKDEPKPDQTVDAKDLMSDISRVRLNQDELDKLDDMLRKARPKPPTFVNDSDIDSPNNTLPTQKEYFSPSPGTDKPATIETLPPPVEEKKEWIPALSDVEIMDMNLNEYERVYDTNSEDYELLSNISSNEVKTKPILTPEAIQPPVTPTPEDEIILTDLGRVRYNPPQFAKGLSVDDYYKEEVLEVEELTPFIPQEIPDNPTPQPELPDDILPEVTDYVAPQIEEPKKK